MRIGLSTDSIVTGSQKKQLLAIQKTQRGVDHVQNILASGKDVNTALDNPQNYFTSRALKYNALDFRSLMDGIGQNIHAVQIASNGVESILKLIDQLEAMLEDAKLTLFNEDIEYPSILPADINDFSSYGIGQDLTTVEFELRDDNRSLYLEGNIWKRAQIDYTITSNTILKFEYQSTSQPEISLIGFDNDILHSNSTDHLFIYGSQVGGITYAAPVTEFVYDGSGDLVSYEINVGQYFTGSFSHVHFGNDHDTPSPGYGNALFQNISLYESDAPESSFRLNETLAIQFDEGYLEILNQIDALVNDASYRGINLLDQDDLVTSFNAERTSKLVSEGIDATSSGLGLTYAPVSSIENINLSLSQIREARKSLRQDIQSFANDLNILSMRTQFTKETINTLRSGADDLTLTDQNKSGAKLLALQTRQQIQFSMLSLVQSSIAEFI